MEARSKRYCGLIEDRSGPFEQCIDYVNYEFFRRGCVFDVCATQDKLESACSTLRDMERACIDKGRPVQEWRQLLGCRKCDFSFKK